MEEIVNYLVAKKLTKVLLQIRYTNHFMMSSGEFLFMMTGKSLNFNNMTSIPLVIQFVDIFK